MGIAISSAIAIREPPQCPDWALLVDYLEHQQDRDPHAHLVRWLAATHGDQRKRRIVLRALNWVLGGGTARDAELECSI